MLWKTSAQEYPQSLGQDPWRQTHNIPNAVECQFVLMMHVLIYLLEWIKNCYKSLNLAAIIEKWLYLAPFSLPGMSSGVRSPMPWIKNCYKSLNLAAIIEKWLYFVSFQFTSHVLRCKIISALGSVFQFAVTGMARQSLMMLGTRVGDHETPPTP